MFTIHCNNCFKRRNFEPALPFLLARCHHIICGSCVPKSTDSAKCPVCNRRFQGIPIARDMPSNVANYFADPSSFLKMYRNISKFQSEQRTHYYQHFYKQQSQLANSKRQLQGYVKLETQLCEQIDAEKKRIVSLRDYIAYYERVGEAPLSNISHSSGSISSSARRMCRPRTPSLSITDTTLTDNDGGLSDNSHQLKAFNRLLPQATPGKSTCPSTKSTIKI